MRGVQTAVSYSECLVQYSEAIREKSVCSTLVSSQVKSLRKALVIAVFCYGGPRLNTTDPDTGLPLTKNRGVSDAYW